VKFDFIPKKDLVILGAALQRLALASYADYSRSLYPRATRASRGRKAHSRNGASSTPADARTFSFITAAIWRSVRSP
jgi:hypothetical protein